MISCRRGHGNIDGSYLPTDPYSYSKVPSQEKEKGLIPFYTPSAVGCSRLTDKLWSVAHTVLPHRKLDTWITHPMTTANSTRTSLKAGQAKRAPCMKVAFVARRRSHVALEANRSWLWWLWWPRTEMTADQASGTAKVLFSQNGEGRVQQRKEGCQSPIRRYLRFQCRYLTW